MPKAFQQLRFHIADTGQKLEQVRGVTRGLRGGAVPGSDEAAARRYLTELFTRDARPVMRGLAAADRPELVPDLKLRRTERLPQTDTTLVGFEQMQHDRPVFGATAIVELGPNQSLVSVNCQVAKVEGVSPFANLSEQQALRKIAEAAGLEDLRYEPEEAPRLYYFNDEKSGGWHLAYLFKDVPAKPKTAGRAEAGRHGLGRSPRDDEPLVNYLVDAHDGRILFSYSAAPTAGAGVRAPKPSGLQLPIPARCRGIDEDGITHTFLGNQAENPKAWELYDTTRGIRTFDLSFGNINSAPLPPSAMRNETSTFSQHRAAISAHVNAARVYDFYNGVLKRHGIDNKGMEIVSVINCTYDEPPPEWHNAVWWKNRMWYGQSYEADKTLRSYSRFLDVIAHELTHGVTKTTADLVYQGQSGALNESISDIFGIAIKNWYRLEDDRKQRDNIARWNWEIGEGLGGDGLPLRDMSTPGRTKDPTHMREWVETSEDWGGVHANSNIHNKAAYNLFTAAGDGRQTFLPEEVATLYYLALLRLSNLATFAEMMQALLDVAAIYYPDESERALKVNAITKAYKDAGIE